MKMEHFIGQFTQPFLFGETRLLPTVTAELGNSLFEGNKIVTNRFHQSKHFDKQVVNKK